MGRPASFVVQPAEGAPVWEAVVPPGAVVIGRAADSGIRIEDDLVSRQHASVRFEADMGGYVFRDLTPTNPSIINGQEYRAPHVLRPGDSVLVGTTLLTFRQGSS
jgi:pSer/pThr/pTyr-binding forkhead associated (FHA) protein